MSSTSLAFATLDHLLVQSEHEGFDVGVRLETGTAEGWSCELRYTEKPRRPLPVDRPAVAGTTERSRLVCTTGGLPGEALGRALSELRAWLAEG